MRKSLLKISQKVIEENKESISIWIVKALETLPYLYQGKAAGNEFCTLISQQHK